MICISLKESGQYKSKTTFATSTNFYLARGAIYSTIIKENDLQFYK